MSPSLLELLKLVGFATGAALHIYLGWIFIRQRGLRARDRSLLLLCLLVGFWHAGNLANTIFELLEPLSLPTWRRGADTIAYAALAFLPPATLHAQLRLLQETLPGRFSWHYLKVRIILCYLPLLILPYSLSYIWRGPYAVAPEKLAPFLVLFILWMASVLVECVGINIYLSRRITARREKKFFVALAVTLLIMSILFVVTYIAGGRTWGIAGRYLEVVSSLSSLVPTALIAYYIYRYRYLELAIRQSFVYASLSLVVMVVYLYGIRRLSAVLETRLGVRSQVVEAILVLGLMFLAEPVRRMTERNMKRLFTREVGLYRNLVVQVGHASAQYHSIQEFASYIQERLSELLALRQVILITETADQIMSETMSRAFENQLEQIEEQDLLDRLDALACYVLWRENAVLGLLLVRGLAADLTSEKREVLSVLSGHIALAVERIGLVEQNAGLERELVEQERLATMGRMAATIAHEIRNPLSSIKSIAQVMREDENVSREYARDLDLITGEVNRLNRSVNQLLGFSRPAAAPGTPATLREIMNDVTVLTRTVCLEHGASVTTNLGIDPVCDGVTASCLRDVLVNVVTNAADAMPSDGQNNSIVVSSRTPFTISVEDSGPGIPPELQARVFEPFYTTKQRGTGLGLSIAMKRIQEIGGEISLESPVANGCGTRFDLVLKPR